MKLQIIGEAPSEHGDPDRPLDGRLGDVLADLLGISYERYMDHTVIARANLLRAWPGERFPSASPEARNRARFFRSTAYETTGSRLLLLGSGVATSFSVPKGLNFLEWLNDISWPPTAVLPHPSGRNLWWNDHRNREAARRFMRELGGQL